MGVIEEYTIKQSSSKPHPQIITLQQGVIQM